MSTNFAERSKHPNTYGLIVFSQFYGVLDNVPGHLPFRVGLQFNIAFAQRSEIAHARSHAACLQKFMVSDFVSLVAYSNRPRTQDP